MVIIEIQSNEGAPSVLFESIENRNEAEQTYHTKLSLAAVSNVKAHSVTMLNDYGERIKGETYFH